MVHKVIKTHRDFLESILPSNVPVVGVVIDGIFTFRYGY